VDRASGRPLTAPAFRSVAGPAADEQTKRRQAFITKNRIASKGAAS
jgi:hypothetical protein